MMKQISLSLLIVSLFTSCHHYDGKDEPDPDRWKDRTVETITEPGLETGSSFLSIYSQIYIRDEKDQYDLTATVSLHNPNALDNIYIDRAVFYNTTGKAIRTYFYKPIFIRPMETLQLVIPILDNEGGTGANFIFDWEKKPGVYDPLFEAIMVSSHGTHGISFITTGKRLR